MTKRVMRWVALAGVVLAGLLGGVWWLRSASAVVQPIVYPHKAHAEQKCRTCHQGVETKAVAGRPPLKRCLSCHGSGAPEATPEQIKKGPTVEEKKIEAYAEKKTEIPWQRVWRLPADVAFSHRQHVTSAKIECKTCHGDMMSLVRPPSRPLVTLTMQTCIECHERWQWPADTPPALATRRVAVDCAACHR